jgi:hypothetical protein
MRYISGEPEPVVRILDREMELIRAAIAMVASGAAPRVSLGSLRFGDQLLEPARQLAIPAGVRVVPLWTSADAGTGLAVERLGDHKRPGDE